MQYRLKDSHAYVFTAVVRIFAFHRCYLLSENAVRYGLSAKLDLERVCTRLTWCVHNTDGSVAVVDNINVDVTLNIAANATRDSALSCLRCVQINHTFLTNRNRCTHSICQSQMPLFGQFMC